MPHEILRETERELKQLNSQLHEVPSKAVKSESARKVPDPSIHFRR